MYDNARNYISISATNLFRLSKISRYLTKSNCLTYKYSKNTITEVYYKKVLLTRCVTMLNTVLCPYFIIPKLLTQVIKVTVVYNSIQKITNISIMKPIILISIMNKYLNISNYLDIITHL